MASDNAVSTTIIYRRAMRIIAMPVVDDVMSEILPDTVLNILTLTYSAWQVTMLYQQQSYIGALCALLQCQLLMISCHKYCRTLY